VIARGGQPEIVNHAIDGLLWRTQNQLMHQTKELIVNDKLRQKLSLQAIKRAKDFSLKKFCSTTKKVFNL
jgi:hypothetical protein